MVKVCSRCSLFLFFVLITHCRERSPKLVWIKGRNCSQVSCTRSGDSFFPHTQKCVSVDVENLWRPRDTSRSFTWCGRQLSKCVCSTRCSITQHAAGCLHSGHSKNNMVESGGRLVTGGGPEEDNSNFTLRCLVLQHIKDDGQSFPHVCISRRTWSAVL